MKLYFIFLKNIEREAVESHLNQHYRRCTAMNQWVLDRDGNPAVYMDWYAGFEKEWMPDALAELQAQIGPGFQHTTLLARLSKRHGNEGDVQNLGGDLLKQFEGVVQNEEETSLSLL